MIETKWRNRREVVLAVAIAAPCWKCLPGVTLRLSCSSPSLWLPYLLRPQHVQQPRAHSSARQRQRVRLNLSASAARGEAQLGGRNLVDDGSAAGPTSVTKVSHPCWHLRSSLRRSESFLHPSQLTAVVARSELTARALSLSLPFAPQAVDMTITAALIQPISASFHASNESSWLGTSFLLASITFTPAFGRLCVRNLLNSRKLAPRNISTLVLCSDTRRTYRTSWDEGSQTLSRSVSSPRVPLSALSHRA